MALDLFTCSYKEFRPAMGVPVRSTVGAPRFPLPYPLAYVAGKVTPHSSMLRRPYSEYRSLYLAMLDRRGVKAVVDELFAIRDAADDHRLVLLCFDDLSKPDAWCHRTMFAEWWLQNTGDTVRELGSHRDDPGPSYEQGSLL